MHDLRHDQEAADAATHYNLRTVKMPDLRSPEARQQDATVPGLRYRYYDTQTSTDRIDALTAQVDDLRKQQAAIAAQLREISEQLQGARG